MKLKTTVYRAGVRSANALRKVLRRLRRSLLIKDVVTPQNCYEVPIIINNRNRVTFLKLMVDQLHRFGYRNIFILDNASTYPPLLEYYKTVDAKVVYLGRNVGYKALWDSDVFMKFRDKHYVYTDPDILLQDDCPHDFVYRLYVELSKYSSKEKAGVALKIDDLPNNSQLQDILSWETPNWRHKLSENVYDAPVDTTMALYKPLAYGNAEECSAIRVGGKLAARHLSWYIDPENLSEEDQYYKSNVNSSSFWFSKK